MFFSEKLVGGRGLTSNRLNEFMQAVDHIGKVFEAHTTLNGKSFECEPFQY